jgi:hypothetical protein
MSNFLEDVEEVIGDEEVVGIVVGARGFIERPQDEDLIDWEEAKPLLNYEYDSGYGGLDCHRITAWTTTRVIFVGEYDGSSWITSVPRNPTPHRSQSIGG